MKRITALAAVLAATLLAACGGPPPTAEVACQPHGGVRADSVERDNDGAGEARCNDNVEIENDGSADLNNPNWYADE